MKQQTENTGGDIRIIPTASIATAYNTMTLRDYFAGQVIGGISIWDLKENDGEYLARKCYALADAMMKERDK